MTGVIDGDTIEVRPVADVATTTVRLTASTRRSPWRRTRRSTAAEDAAADLTDLLAERPNVVLTTDPSQDRNDRFGRLLAYVDV